MNENKVKAYKKIIDLEEELLDNRWHFEGSDVLDWQSMMSLIDDIKELMFTQE